MLACAAALVSPASAFGAHSVGTHAQIAWVRSAASRFVAAELAGNGGGACAVLNAPLRFTEGNRTCEQRWDAKLARLLSEPGGRERLKAQARAIASAPVIVDGYTATLDLSTPLMGGANHFRWSEDCWMLAS